MEEEVTCGVEYQNEDEIETCIVVRTIMTRGIVV